MAKENASIKSKLTEAKTKVKDPKVKDAIDKKLKYINKPITK